MSRGSPELTAARREEIIAACAELNETMSFREITIKEIGAATSFTRTSIYNYFETKEEIFLALLQKEYELWVEAMDAVMADQDAMTVDELAQTIAELLNFDLQPTYMPGRPQEVKLATCSADKARKLLGYQTQYTLRQGLQEMIDYIKDRGAKKFRYHLDLEIVNEKTPKTWSKRLF